MSAGNWQTFVVVVDWGKKSWTVGPFHNRTKAESAIEALPTIDGLNAWVEPVVHPDDYLAAIEAAKRDKP